MLTWLRNLWGDFCEWRARSAMAKGHKHYDRGIRWMGRAGNTIKQEADDGR